MDTVTTTLASVLKDEDGATAIEYGLLAALIAVVLISVLTTLGTTLQAKFQAIVTGLG